MLHAVFRYVDIQQSVTLLKNCCRLRFTPLLHCVEITANRLLLTSVVNTVQVKRRGGHFYQLIDIRKRMLLRFL